MSMLHIINKSPFERSSLDSCLKTSKEGCSILLIEDAVVGSLKGTAVADKLTEAMATRDFYVLEEDLKARGFSSDSVLEGVKTVDYPGFVELTVKNDNVQSWL